MEPQGDESFRWLVLPAELESLVPLSEFARQAARDAGLAAEKTWKLELALEEALVNVFRYAYPEGRPGSVHVGCAVRGTDRLLVRISDAGPPFDPLARDAPDLTAGIEDRPVGGLGVFLLREMVDGVAYRHTGGMNHLTLEFAL